MTSWIVDALDQDLVAKARTEATRRLLCNTLGLAASHEDDKDLRFVANTLELAVFDLLGEESQLDTLRTISADAFHLLRELPRPVEGLEAAKACLRLACMGVLGERGGDVARLLKKRPWPAQPLNSLDWGERTWATILDIWLRLLRKDGWADLTEVHNRVVALREHQRTFEEEYLQKEKERARTAAWELVAFYHLAKAGELMATFTTQGHVDNHYDILEQLDTEFDRALSACGRADLIELESLARLLLHTARQLVDNSIWTVTRAVNSRVSLFVQQLTKGSRPMFETLPPQRRALREEQLLGSSYRSVVVSLPTSSGKTLIAQFRMLQALNQFDLDRGWVAYLAPTRALVNQVCARLRRDFSPLNIAVERVSPALEVDGLEAALLTDAERTTQFRVLVTTPEKLDLMIRGGWEERIGRPLSLVVVDEAHNLAQSERGIKLELLLATINRDCRHAQFLLLTPFVQNATEIARWLDARNYKDVQLGLDWQPNDLAVMLSYPRPAPDGKHFSLKLETLHTNKKTLTVPEILDLREQKPLGLTWSRVKKSFSDVAAATVHSMKDRGPVIVLASRPDWVWGLAKRFKHEDNARTIISDEIRLAQRFLYNEFGKGFELCELLEYGVGVHHAGLSDEAKGLMEWLLEKEMIHTLVATTTIAQGVNFPVSGVVLAHNKYYDETKRGMVEMPPEDFWNLAGRCGRLEQGAVGIVALAATTEESASELKRFVGNQVRSLNSTLVEMVKQAMKQWGQFQLHSLHDQPQWSAFLQYLAHTYRQIGDPNRFALEVEQILRGTLGFQELRRENPHMALFLVSAVQAYGERIAGKPLSLVDSTGFSWESVSTTLGKLSENRVREDVWDPERLFRGNNRDLQKLMGILLSVPELRGNLQAAISGRSYGGDFLARIVSDWVEGASLPDLASQYFSTDKEGNPVDGTTALTDCCKNIYGRLVQTVSWGLSALQSLTLREGFDRLSETEQVSVRNLPARVFYGVNSDEAIAMRLLGVPRGAAHGLAIEFGNTVKEVPLPKLRNLLVQSQAETWRHAMGEIGQDYFTVWRILEGIDQEITAIPK